MCIRDSARECNNDILIESETKETNILTKKHTARPDSQNCSRSVTGDLGVRREKKQLWSLEDYGASERQRPNAKTTEEANAAHTHALTHTHTRTNSNHPRAHARTIHGTGRSAGATPRRLTRRGRPTPTAAAVRRAEPKVLDPPPRLFMIRIVIMIRRMISEIQD